MNRSRRSSAFTLVELSIVLVILGLLVGGVLTGQSLIRAAELRSIATQHATYLTAVQTFRDKYFALPGDMTNATSYWNAAAVGAACFTTASTDSKTCDGNGNGQVLMSNNSNEIYRFWQQLANAGLIEGSYDGITHGTDPNYSTTAANAPVGKLSATLWSVYYWVAGQGVTGNVGNMFIGTYENTLIFGRVIPNNMPVSPFLKPEEAYNIDMKLDDGKPGLGKLVVYATGSGLAGCTNATGSNAVLSASINADYLLTNTAQACALLFPRAF